jgi:glucuronosyltransferase
LNHPKDSIDLVIYDFTIGPCLLGFLQHFGSPPLVSMTAFGIPQFSNNLVFGPKSYSTVPHFALRYGNQMSFNQRVVNFLAHSFDQL